ncbi:MAG: trehalose-6-phosphate synthase, partial [Terriglobia bacterium]
MERLLIVSNRLPVSVVKRPRSLKLQPSAGGLATGLSSFYQSHRSMWVGWPGLPADRLSADEKAEAVESLRARDCHPVFLSRADVDGYYHGFCNRAIWPLFHYFSSFAEYEKGQWQAYKKANEAFADVVTAVAEPGDRIWIHDYQLMLLPRLLRRRMADASIG